MLRDEEHYRRPGFAHGLAVELADGSCWALAPPVVDMAALGDPSRLEAGLPTTFGREFDHARATVSTTKDASDAWRKAFFLGVVMLRQNYDLTNEQIKQLLRFRPNDEGNAEMWTEVIACANGKTSKTAGNWIRAAFLQTGLYRGPVLLCDAATLIGFQVNAKLTPAAYEWCDELRSRIQGGAFAGMAGPA